MTTTADLIRAAMLPRNIFSGRQLAYVADMKHRTVARILAGERDVTLTELSRIARALHVEPADLIPASAA